MMLIGDFGYTHIISIEKHFGKRNPRSVIIEYKFQKYTVYILFPLFLFALAFIILSRVTEENPLVNLIKSLGDPILISLFLTIMGIIFFIVGAALLRTILLNSHKRFRFYLERIFFRCIGTLTDDVDKIKYLIRIIIVQ